MNTLIVLVAAIACVVAEPPLLFKTGLPHLHDFRSIFNPVTLPLRTEIPLVKTVPLLSSLKTQYDERDIFGQARYGHVEPGQSHHAVQDIFGNKAGGFSYYDSEGKLIRTSYIADSAGYRVSTIEDPIVAPVSVSGVPVLPVEDTPEVKALKIAHLHEVEKIKLRGKRDLIGRHIISPIIPTIDYKFPTLPALPTTITKPELKTDGFLADTPEVKFAKDRHLFGVEVAKARNSLTPLTYPFFRYTPYDYSFVKPVLI